MRKYFSAEDNSIRILWNFSQWNILSFIRNLSYLGNIFPLWIKQKNVAFSIFPIGINDLSIQENILAALISLNLSYRENIFPLWIILLPKE
jgi:hypothetical protein